MTTPRDTDKTTAEEIRHLRETHYNAVVTHIQDIHSALRILRVQPDSGRLTFEPGQYTTLGLGAWERTIGQPSESAPPVSKQILLKRAYSFSARVLDEHGQLIDPRDDAQLEFYLALVPATHEHPAGLTPRLFVLQPGDRLFIGPHAKGRYTLTGAETGDDVIFAATGVGEAPHNPMIARLLSGGHRGRILSVVGVRLRSDLAYLAVHQRLEQIYPQYRYVPLTTREPENLDPSRPGYRGKQYVQQFFASGAVDRALGKPLTPTQTHVFLCGNPAMVGAPQHTDGNKPRFAHSGGMCELLEQRGFRIDAPGTPGNVHHEEYGTP